MGLEKLPFAEQNDVKENLMINKDQPLVRVNVQIDKHKKLANNYVAVSLRFESHPCQDKL